MLLRPEILLYGMHFMGTAELKNSNTREEHRRIYGLMFLRAEILLCSSRGLVVFCSAVPMK